MMIEVPKHIAIIMDGNGRWAKENGQLSRIMGHAKGAKVLMEIMDEALDVGVKYLTCYTFSSENWSRPDSEVNFIIGELVPKYLRMQHDYMMTKGIRFKAIGELEKLPALTQEVLDETTSLTKDNDKMQVTLALNYGGRQEILSGIRKLVKECVFHPIKVTQITEETFRKYLYDPGLPDPDLLIRTSGEYRISNFLLWQLSYTEIWVTNIYWPDFKREDFRSAINDYVHRHRRYGGING